LWDTATGTLKNTLIAHDGGVDAVAFGADGMTLITAGGHHLKPRVGPRAIKLWDAVSLAPPATLGSHPTWICSSALSAAGQPLLSGSEDGVVKVWDLARQTLRHTCQGHTEGVLKVAIAPDGATAASAGKDGTIRLWDTASGRESTVLRGHVSQV